MATATYNNSNSTAQSLTDKVNGLSSYSPYAAIGKAAIKGVSSYYNAMAQRKQLEAQSSDYALQAQTATLNSSLAGASMATLSWAENLAQYDIRNATLQVYNTYKMGEYQAMQQGLEDAQVIHSERAKTASSGVRMDSASKQEIDSDNVRSARMNQRAIQANTWSSVSEAQSQVRQAEANLMNLKTQKSDLLIQQYNYNAQAIIARGNADASNIMAKAISPFVQGITAVASSVVGSYFGGAFGSWSSAAGEAAGAVSGASTDTFDYTNFTSSLAQRSTNMMNARISLGSN